MKGGDRMAIYILLSTLTDEGRKTIKNNPERIKEVAKEVEQMGAKVLAQFALLGMYDFLNILEAPDNETIARVSIELGSRGTIQLMTLAATPVFEFIEKMEGTSSLTGDIGKSSVPPPEYEEKMI